MPKKLPVEWTTAQKVDYWANSSNLISVNNGNAKTGAICFTLSFPRCSCAKDVPCRKDCYCSKGHQQWPTVLGAYWRNWRIWNENPELFEKQLDAFIDFAGIPLFRYMDCGDIPSREFLDLMFRVAKGHPDTKFLAYTKKYALVNEKLDEEALPENLTIRFSHWDVKWELESYSNPHNLPDTYVEFKDERLTPTLPEKAFVCQGGKETTCSACRVCFNKKVQHVIFHQH